MIRAVRNSLLRSRCSHYPPSLHYRIRRFGRPRREGPDVRRRGRERESGRPTTSDGIENWLRVVVFPSGICRRPGCETREVGCIGCLLRASTFPIEMTMVSPRGNARQSRSALTTTFTLPLGYPRCLPLGSYVASTRLAFLLISCATSIVRFGMTKRNSICPAS